MDAHRKAALYRLVQYAIRKRGMTHPHVKLISRFYRSMLPHNAPDHAIFRDMRLAGMLLPRSPRNLTAKAQLEQMGYLF